jgi:hypothetical protein
MWLELAGSWWVRNDVDEGTTGISGSKSNVGSRADLVPEADSLDFTLNFWQLEILGFRIRCLDSKWRRSRVVRQW